MTKKWQLFLSSILFSSCTVVSLESVSTFATSSYSKTQKRAFYENINQNFVNNKADVAKALVGSNATHNTSTGLIFYWRQYADSWHEFTAHYYGLDLKINMDIAFNWYNVKWQNTDLHIPLSNITINGTNWIPIAQVDQTTTQRSRWDHTHGALYYDCWVNDNSVFIRFKLDAWASNNYDNYYYTVDTRSVTCNSSFNYDTVKSLFNEKVNNKSLVLDSDYSTSLQDERNKKVAETALDNLISGALGDYYEIWKPYITPYSYSNATNQATISIKFTDPNSKKNILWTFKVTIKFNLTQDYWTKQFKERLTITPGKIIDPNNPNDKIITDEPLEWEGKDVYGTTAFIRFDGAPDGSETMKVNGVPIQVINNQFTFQMTDNQEHETNEYDILLEKHDLDDFSKIKGKYQIKYLIKQNVPNLDLTWYAWNPAKNPDQKKLIEPVLPNGERNPDYDSEVNVKTGTKTQIIWVKHKAANPFPLDPLDKNGNIITNDGYEEGFLAEGSVSGMGIVQQFDDPWIKLVQRIKVDDKTLQPIGPLETIKSDNNGSNFSLAGTYLYIITDQKGITSNKFIIIGQKWQSKYAKFLDVLDNSNTAVSFWSSLQGFHLKKYLEQYKSLNSADIRKLSFEQVSSYWKEYVSDIKSQRIGPGIDSGNTIDLNSISLDAIKMNANKISIIKNNIVNGVTKQLNKYNLEYNIDYQIKDLETKIKDLLLYDSNGNAIVTMTINALDTSIKARNNIKVTVRNSQNYVSEKVTDLSKIKFDDYYYNFSEFTSEQLKNWILTAIENKFKSLKLQLVYQVDYEVIGLDDTTLRQFISAKKVVKLKVMIKAKLLSDLTINSTNLTVINDPDGEIAPRLPPNPKPEPNPIPIPDTKSSWIVKQKNLIFMSVIVGVLISCLSIIVFFKYRLKRGIGGKRIKKTKANN